MSLLVIQLGDSAISCLYRGTVLLTEPGYAAVDSGRLVFGSAAKRRIHASPRSVLTHCWRELSQEPLDRPEFDTIGDLGSTADVVHAHVRDLWKRCPRDVDAVVCTVPPYWSREQLALLLGILDELSIPIRALVDNTVASVRREYVGSTVSVIEASLHEVTVSTIDQTDCASVSQRHSIEDVGIERLERFCVEYISARFLEQCRFDPTSTSDSEQVIYDRLYTWLGRIERTGEVRIDMEYGGNQFQAVLTSDEISNAVAGYCEPIALRLREITNPGDGQTLLVDFNLAEFPGVVKCFESIAGSTVEILQPAAGALGVARRVDITAADGDDIRYLTRLPWDRPAIAAADTQTSAGPGALPPTHVLIANVAYRLAEGPVEIGSEIDDHQYGVSLDRPAVSRSHCSIHLDGSRAIVSDHSRYGTRLNGHRIKGSAVLQVGDVVGVGDPAAEFYLIREEQAGGATPV